MIKTLSKHCARIDCNFTTYFCGGEVQKGRMPWKRFLCYQERHKKEFRSWTPMDPGAARRPKLNQHYSTPQSRLRLWPACRAIPEKEGLRLVPTEIRSCGRSSTATSELPQKPPKTKAPRKGTWFTFRGAFLMLIF